MPVQLFAGKTERVMLIKGRHKRSSPGKAGTGIVADYMKLQYWPASLKDSKAINYESKSVPGSSNPFVEWVNSGERTLSFVAELVCEVDPNKLAGVVKVRGLSVDKSDFTRPFSGNALGSAPSQEKIDRYWDADKSVTNINRVVRWLRRFMYPGRSQDGSYAIPPEALWVDFGNTILGEKGRNSVWCKMTNCGVDYKRWFPDGTPRRATVDLSFTEVYRNSNANEIFRAEDFDESLR